MSSSPSPLIGRMGSRRGAVDSLRRFLSSSHPACSFEVWGVARIGKTQVVTAAVEEAKRQSRKKIHVLPDDQPQPLSLRRLYEVVRRWSDRSRPEPRDGWKTRFSELNTTQDLFSEINRILDERTRPEETVLLRILISAIDNTADEFRDVFRNSNGWSSGRKIVLEMRQRIRVHFFPDASLHGEMVRIVGLHGDEPEKMVFCKLANHFDEARIGRIARAARQWCGRHPGLLETFLERILQGDFGLRLLATMPEDINPLVFHELVDGESTLSEDVKAILGNLPAEARQQVFEPPENSVLHIDLVESGLTSDDEGRHIALLARRFCQKLRIFVSYASEDREDVAGLTSKLAAIDGLKPIWDYDPDTLRPGDEWEERLLSQVRVCDAFLFFCTQSSRDKLKTSYILGKEVAIALGRPGDCLIIPVGQPSMVPDDLRAHQWVDLTFPGGYDDLVEQLKQRRTEIWRSAAKV